MYLINSKPLPKYLLSREMISRVRKQVKLVIIDSKTEKYTWYLPMGIMTLDRKW